MKPRNLTADALKESSSGDVLNYIREKLKFNYNLLKQLHCYQYSKDKNEHRRFDFSGDFYEGIVSNINIINEFADLGIYDNLDYLFVKFYKGSAIIYYKYVYDQNCYHSEDLSGLTTSEIIYEIFKITIFIN